MGTAARPECYQCHYVFPKTEMSHRAIQAEYKRNTHRHYRSRQPWSCENCLIGRDRKSSESTLYNKIKVIFRGSGNHANMT